MPDTTAADALRPAMLRLIAHVRRLVGEADADGCACSSVVTDDQIQRALDDGRERVRYQRLCPIEQYGPGGTIQYREFADHGGGWMDDDAALTTHDYYPLTGEQVERADPLRGEWATAQSYPLGVLVTGHRYDPYGAAADLLRSLRASSKWLVDSADANLRVNQSQALANVARLEGEYRRSARIRSITFGRSDTP